MPKAPILRFTPEQHVAKTDADVAWLEPYKRALRATWDKQFGVALEEERRLLPWREETHPQFGKVLVFKGLADGELEQLRRSIAKRFADNAEQNLQQLNAEISSMMTRTSIIVAATTLMFALFALGLDSARSVKNVILTVTLTITALAFITGIKPLRPPFMRAWVKPFSLSAHWTLLAKDDFMRWVVACILGDRRTPVITAYKRAHAVAVPLLWAGSIMALVTLVIRLFM